MPKKETKKQEKPQIEDLSQTDGKEEKEEAAPSTLDQIWGDTGLWRYNTMDFDEYSSDLKDLSKSDLQLHATKVGIIPIDNRDMLTARLEREFKKHVSSYEASVPKKDLKIPENEDELPTSVRKILEEGR